MSFVSFAGIFTGVVASLELIFGGLKREEVRLVRTGGEAALMFSDSLLGEFIVDLSVGGGVLI